MAETKTSSFQNFSVRWRPLKQITLLMASPTSNSTNTTIPIRHTMSVANSEEMSGVSYADRMVTPENSVRHLASGVERQATSTHNVPNVQKNIGTEADLHPEEDRDKETYHTVGRILQRHTVHTRRVPNKRIKAEEQVRQLR